MPDMTVTWQGAVPFDSFKGQNVNKGGKAVDFDVAAMAAGFDIQPVHGDNVVSALDGAVPYAAAGDDFSWADEFEQAKVSDGNLKPAAVRGRPKKAG